MQIATSYLEPRTVKYFFTIPKIGQQTQGTIKLYVVLEITKLRMNELKYVVMLQRLSAQLKI